MAGNNGNASQFLAPPTVAALREEARISSQHQVAMGRSFSEDMQAEREDLREAAEETLNVILDLGLDGHIKWVSPSWRHVIGTDPESVEGKVISDVLWTNKFCFQDAIKSMKEDDSRSRFIRFSVAMGPDSILKSSIKESSSTIKDADSHHEGEANKDSAGDGESDKSVDAKEQNGEDILDMEAQGIMIYDRSGDGEGHAMWMLRPSTSPKEVTIDLPPLLVESLGVGAEVLANHLTVLAERAAGASADKSVTPTPVLCRICERQITPWWFEKHSELCLQEHTAELEVQIAQENLNEHRHAIVKVLDALEARQGRSFPTDTQQPTPQPEYKGLPIGPSPSSSLSSSAPGSSPATPPRSRDPSTSGLGHGRGRSFAVRRPLARIVELILDLCDTALEISTPALKETRTDCIEDLRTLSPQSESRICQVLQWQSPSSNTLEQEQGLAALSADTEQAAKAKVDAVVRHRRIVEYAERIRVEYAVMVEECIDAALSKAERIAAGDLSDSTSTTGSYDSEGEQVRTVDQINEEDEQQTSQDTESNAALSLEHSSDVATRESDPSPLSQSPRRGSSVAVSTRSASPLECPTPRSHKSISGILGTFQPIKRGSLLAESDIGENSDSSSVPSSSLIAATRVSESPSSEKGISHSSSGRSTKRKSLILPNLSSSPRRQASPGRAPGSGSPLRLSKPRLPSGESMPSPSISPLLTTNELTSQGLPPHHQLHTHHHHHHRRQSSTASSDPRAPISPHLSSVSQPQPRPAPPSIKDFEIIKPISKGAFGSVYLSKKKTTGEYFAIKVLKKADMVAKNQVTNVKAERAIMMWQGESDFVAKLYWTFSSKDYLYLVMEYLNGGDCASLVKILGGLPEDWAKKYIAEVVLGVEHLHNRGIVHRDLKPDNLLIDPRGHLKLTDFGLSRMGLVGRQKRVLKSPNESAPDLLKQGPFPRAMSLVSSRSASFDFQGGHSPSSTPIITPDTAGSYNQPSYFSLSQLPPPRESLGRASGYRSDSGGSDTLNAMFRTFSLSEGAETPAPLPSLSQAVTEDEAPSEGGESPHLIPLSQTVSATSSAVHNTPPTQSMLPPPMALFDPEDHNRRFVGTPDYLAPETINGVGQDEMSDWWSLGCILFEFLYGYPPFNAATPDQVFENILHRRINWPDEAQELVSSEAIDLMNKLMTIDPQQRLGANIEEKFPNGGAEIRSHPWFADVNWDTLLEDKAEFVPNPENPEDTEYFDARGATLQSFEELEDAPSPQYPMTAGEYPDRPHDALSRVRSQVNSMKRGLMPLHIPPHVRDTRSRRLSEPVLADDFGNFNFKNLPMLERANKDVIQRLRQEAMQAQQRQIPSSSASPSVPSSTPSLEGSPLLPMPLQRTLSQTKGNRPVSPSGLSQTGSSPNRPSQPSSPLLVQFSTGQNHERRKTSGSSSAQSQQSVGSLSEKFGEGVPRLTASAKLASSAPTSNKPGRSTTHSPEKTASGLPQSGITRARSQTIGSQDSEGHSVSSKDPFIPSHHKRRSQLFDISPSSSDNEDPRTKALLKVQRRRQSTRRLSQINLLDGPVFRPLDILICEDHPVSRLVMERLFEKLRCRTITAVNGSEAIRYALSEVQFDIIMTEVKLPQINGADVARMIRETRSANRHTPIIAVTGYLKDLPETHHFNALIEKPPTLNKLTEALSTFCQWKAPPKDYVPTHSLMIPPPIPRGINHTEDSPSSISSGFHPVPSSSYRGSSRADSVGSSYFGDMESNKAEEIPVVISRHTDSWGDTSEGLGILEGAAAPAVDPKLNTNFPSSLSLSPLQHAFSAPPTSNPPSLIVPRKQRSSEAIRAKRESLEKRRYEGAESGDDEDEELGHFQTRHRAPHTSKGARSSSKLGTEMMRTNSRGSVVSGSEEILAKESAAESGAGDVHDLEEQLGAFDMSLDEASSPERRYSKPESPRSSRSPDHIRRPTLEPLHEYPTEIRSPDSSDLRAQSLTMGISTQSKEGTTNGGDASLGQIGTTSGDPTDSEGMDPDATPRPAPTPDMSELDDTTPRGSVKGRHEGNQERPGGQTGHIHLRDVLHWRRR